MKELKKISLKEEIDKEAIQIEKEARCECFLGEGIPPPLRGTPL